MKHLPFAILLLQMSGCISSSSSIDITDQQLERLKYISSHQELHVDKIRSDSNYNYYKHIIDERSYGDRSRYAIYTIIQEMYPEFDIIDSTSYLILDAWLPSDGSLTGVIIKNDTTYTYHIPMLASRTSVQINRVKGIPKDYMLEYDLEVLTYVDWSIIGKCYYQSVMDGAYYVVTKIFFDIYKNMVSETRTSGQLSSKVVRPDCQ